MDVLVDRRMSKQGTGTFLVLLAHMVVFFASGNAQDAAMAMPLGQGGVAPAPVSMNAGALQMASSAAPIVQPPQQQIPSQAFVPSAVVVTQPGAAGPNTIDDSAKIGLQGNWVKKREWLIKAHELNNEVQDLADKVEPIRKDFTERFNKIDSTLDVYYKSAGLGQGKIDDLFEDIMRYLDKKRKRTLVEFNVSAQQRPDPDVQAKIDLVEDEVKDARQQLEQLKLNMKSIEDLGRSLGDRMKRLDEQSNQISEEADRASKIAEEMWDIIDHNKARDSFYQIKVSSEKIKNIQAYLSEDLMKDFDSVSETINSQIQQTQDQVKKLEDNGFFIKNRAERVKEAKVKKIEEEKKKRKEVIAAKKKIVLPPPTFLSRLVDMAKNFMKNIYTAFVWLKNKVWGSGAKTSVVKTNSQSSVVAAGQQMPPVMPGTQDGLTPQTGQQAAGAALTTPPVMPAPDVVAQPAANMGQNQNPAPVMPAPETSVPVMPPAAMPTS